MENIKQFIKFSNQPYSKTKKVIPKNYSNTSKISYTEHHSTTHYKQYVGQN
jgi:hypothetical protein